MIAATLTASPQLDARLAAIASLAASLGSATEVRVQIPEHEVDKARWLDESGRPFFEITSRLQSDVAKAMRKAADDAFAEDGTILTAAELFYVGGEAVRRVFLKRFADGGYDVRLAPLSPAWRWSKVRRGYSMLIGVYTGQLLAALRRARITFNARS